MSISRPPRRRNASARRQFVSFAIISALLLTMLLPTRFAPVVTNTVEAVSTTVVISQFQVAGGTAADEFVELHNVSSSNYDLNGHRVVYRSAAGTSDVAVVNWTTSTIIPAGGYYLIAHATGYDGTTAADITFPGGSTGTFAAAGGGLAIRNGAANTGTVIDSVGYGTATNAFVETSVTTAPAANASKARTNNGCTDTDNNSADFALVNPSTPRNSATTPVICGGGGGTPTLNIGDVTQAEGSGGGTTNFTFTVSLTSAAPAGGVTFNWSTADGTTNPANAGSDYTAVVNAAGSITEGNSSTTVTVQVAADTTGEPNETFFVNITNVTNATPGDVQGLGTINNDDVTVTPVYNIQGSGMSSPLAGQSNISTTGIVTARRSLGASNNGFYIQDPNGDGNLNTSDAILVFTGSTVPTVGVGDSVQVTGTIVEFESSTTDEPDGVSPPDPKTATEITSPTTVVLSTGNTLPAALDATSLNILDPTATSRGAQLEKYEYMRISVPSLTVSQPTNNFGEFWGVEPPRPRPFREPGIERGDPIPPADEGPHAGSPPPAVPVWDGNFERIMVDTGAALVATGSTRRTQVQVTTGTVVTNIVGPLDYAFDQYRIVLDYNVTPGVSGGLTSAVPVPLRTDQEFTIGHANLENFVSSNATKMNKASLAIRNVLRTPDILGIIEVDTAASATALANKVNADAADPNVNYVAYFGETSATQDIGYLVNTARVTVVGTPEQYHAGTTFNYCGVNDTLHDRPSFILTATVPRSGGGTLPVTAILNHTKSLIAVDSPRPFGSCGTGTEGARNREKRRLQAEDIADLIESRQNENLVVLGDLNAFDVNDGLVDVVNTIRGVPPPPDQVVEPSTDRWDHQLTNLLTKLTPDQRYSYVFEGNAQTIDHVLVNANMLARNNRFAYARYNADFSDSFAADSTRPEGVADHDAPVAYFTTGVAQPSGSFIISEYRLRGPGAETDEFVELYNNTESTITVSTVDGSPGWSLAASDGTVRFTVPNGTEIPARGHYLGCNATGYSLSTYPAGDGTTAMCDVTFIADIPSGSGLALFNTADPSNFNETTRLDAVGYDNNPALYREGAGFQTAAPGAEVGSNIEYSFLRDLTSGTPKDTNSNTADFIPVSTTALVTSIGQRLGAPGPENISSPIRRLNVYVDRLDQSVVASAAPNRVRQTCGTAPECNPNRSALGTLSIRRTVTNYTGQPVTRLRFRVNDITSGPIPAGTADLRVITSSDITVTLTNGQQVAVQGTVVEEPPSQITFGGGLNTSLSTTGTISMQSPLAPGASVNVQFLFGVQQSGTFRVFVIVEALP